MKAHTSNISIFFLIAGIWLVNTFSLSAQPGENLERIKAERVAFFTEKLELTSAESDKFWPLYNDYTNRKEKLLEEERMILRYVNLNEENMDEKEISESLKRYSEIQKKSLDLFNDYNRKFSDILPPSKVIKIYIAENQFKQHLLRKISDSRPGRQGGRRF